MDDSPAMPGLSLSLCTSGPGRCSGRFWGGSRTRGRLEVSDGMGGRETTDPVGENMYSLLSGAREDRRLSWILGE
jgi:hypothetical protein